MDRITGAIMFKILFVIASYLLGSVCFGYVFAKISKKEDFGKNDLPGGAGSSRQLGFAKGIAVGFLDTLKGAIPPLLATRLFHWDSSLSGQIAILASCLAVIIGHNWPVFFKFRGGGGLSSTIGISFALIPLECGIAFPVAIATGFIYKYTLAKRLPFSPIPVGAGMATLLLPILCYLYNEPLYITVLFSLIFVLLTVKSMVLTKLYGTRGQSQIS